MPKQSTGCGTVSVWLNRADWDALAACEPERSKWLRAVIQRRIRRHVERKERADA